MKLAPAGVESDLQGQGGFRLGGPSASQECLSLCLQPAGQDVHVVQGPDLLLQRLEQCGRFRGVVPQQGIRDLCRVAQAPDPTPQRVQLVRLVSLAEGCETAEDGLAFCFPSRAHATEDREEVVSLPGYHPPQVAPHARDLEVQEGLRHASSASRPRGPEPPPQIGLLHREGRKLAQVDHEELEAHVEVAACSGGAGQGPEDPQGAPHPLALWLSPEQGQGHPKPPPRHPHLVDGLLVAGEPLRKVLEDRAHTIAEQR